MKKITLLIASILVCSSMSFGQCKYYTKARDVFAYGCKSDCIDGESDLVMTKPKQLFDIPFYGVGTVTFVKSGDDYYLRVGTRMLWTEEFFITRKNSLILGLENNDSIEVFPLCSPKTKGWTTTFTTCCFYKITKEQIKSLTESKISMVTIYKTSIYEGDPNEYFIISAMTKKQESSCMENANCILSYN